MNAKTQFATKAALATCLAIWAALFFHLQDPYWAGISAFLVCAEQVGNSLYKTMLRIGCTLVGVTMGILCVHFFINEPVALLLSTFLIMTYTIYRGMRDDQFYLWIFTAITFFMVVTEFIATGNTLGTLNIGLYRAIDISLGSIIGFVTGLLIFPTHASQQLNDKLNTFLQAFEAYYGKTIDDLFIAENKTLLKQLRLDIATAYQQTYQLSLHAARESLLFERTRCKIHQHLQRIGIALKELQDFEANYNTAETFYIPRFKSEILQLKNTFQAFLKDPFTHKTSAQQALNLLYDRYDALRRTGKSLQHEATELIAFHELLGLHQSMLDLFSQDQPSFSVIFRPKIKNWIEHLSQNRVYLLFGSKVAIAMLALPITWVAFAIPGASQLGVSMGAILNLDFAASKKKGLMRFYGCLIGAGLALIAIILIQVESLSLLMLLIFIAAFCFAYIQDSNADRSYLGVQAIVAFLMGTVVGFAPTLIPDPAVERLISITCGVSFLFIMLEWIWPFTKAEKTQHYQVQINSAFKRLNATLEAYFAKPEFDFINSIALDITAIKRNQKQFTEDGLIDSQQLIKAQKADALNALLIFISQHITTFKKYESAILATLTALENNSPEALNTQSQHLEQLIQNVRSQVKLGQFLPVEETILLASFVRKGMLLLQTPKTS